MTITLYVLVAPFSARTAMEISLVPKLKLTERAVLLLLEIPLMRIEAVASRSTGVIAKLETLSATVAVYSNWLAEKLGLKVPEARLRLCKSFTPDGCALVIVIQCSRVAPFSAVVMILMMLVPTTKLIGVLAVPLATARPLTAILVLTPSVAVGVTVTVEIANSTVLAVYL